MIRKLPTLLVNQIAAGEVIERPASVVKELVENALDAGATRIEITVEDGGRRLMRVSDNGTGIAPDELELAVAPHATSKLHSAEQLAAIHTLGFRGEALASVGSVARLRVTSRPMRDGRLAEAAHRIEVVGGEVSGVVPDSGAPGTVVEVRDLFFNTPARRKFMRTAQTEFGHINETVSRIAMVQPAVAIKLVHNQRTVLDVPATDDASRRCIEMLGTELEEGLLAFEHIEPPARGGARVWGLAGTPAIARGTSRHQFLAVNRRPVRDRNLLHAVKEAYRGLIPPDRQPVAVVFVEIDAGEVDVNVHPAKAEVRFRNPSQVHGLVLAAMRQRLLGADLTPSAALPGAASPGAGLPGAEAPSPLENGTHGVDSPASGTQSAISNVSASAFVDYFRRMDPKQKGFVYEQVKRAVDADADDHADDRAQHDVFANGDSTPPSGAAHEPAVRRHDILQVHQSYVVTQDDDGLLIVDQHALHERVMYQQLWQRVLGEGQRLESQRLLMPAVVHAGAGRQATLEALTPLLERIGMEVEPIGPESVAVQAFASFLFDRNVEPAEFLEELLDKADNGEIDVSALADSSTALEAALHEVLDMMACKAAVKAGDKLDEQQLAALLEQRQQVERSSNCPHGRPTTIRLTLGELAKHFKRA